MPDIATSSPNRHLDTVLGRLALADIGQGLPSDTLGIEECFEVKDIY